MSRIARRNARLHEQRNSSGNVLEHFVGLPAEYKVQHIFRRFAGGQHLTQGGRSSSRSAICESTLTSPSGITCSSNPPAARTAPLLSTGTPISTKDGTR